MFVSYNETPFIADLPHGCGDDGIASIIVVETVIKFCECQRGNVNHAPAKGFERAIRTHKQTIRLPQLFSNVTCVCNELICRANNPIRMHQPSPSGFIPWTNTERRHMDRMTGSPSKFIFDSGRVTERAVEYDIRFRNTRRYSVSPPCVRPINETMPSIADSFPNRFMCFGEDVGFENPRYVSM